MISELTKLPSIIFISETRVQDEKEKFQKPQIKIPGFTLVLNNSKTNAGGTAIYVSDDLKFKERDDIIFNYPIMLKLVLLKLYATQTAITLFLVLCTGILVFMPDHFVVI